MSDLPVHRRTIEVTSYSQGDTLRVAGRLRDERPQLDRQVMHDMELVLRVRTADLLIVEADAQMHAFPHDECPFISPRFASMVGLSVSRGFTRALRELFAGVSGCQHLHELARVTGPAVFQANAALRSAQRDRDLASQDPATAAASAMRTMRGTCHIWAPDGAAQRKLELGWLPGKTGFPVPSVDQLREHG